MESFKGKCGIIKSNSDIQSKIKIICEGDYVKIKKERDID